MALTLKNGIIGIGVFSLLVLPLTAVQAKQVRDAKTDTQISGAQRTGPLSFTLDEVVVVLPVATPGAPVTADEELPGVPGSLNP